MQTSTQVALLGMTVAADAIAEQSGDAVRSVARILELHVNHLMKFDAPDA